MNLLSLKVNAIIPIQSFNWWRILSDFNFYKSSPCLSKFLFSFFPLFASVHTASNLTVDRSVTRSQVTPTPSGSKHTLPAGEETGSIPEEMDHSVADSVVSDVGLDVAEDDSLAEVLTGDSLKKPSG